MVAGGTGLGLVEDDDGVAAGEGHVHCDDAGVVEE